jgi:signal transduction histidine kinase
MPYGRCAAYSHDLLRAERIGDILVAGAYFWFPIRAFLVVRESSRGVGARPNPYPALTLLTLAFIVFCGATHGLKVATGYSPWLLQLSVSVTLATGAVSLAAVAAIEGAWRAIRRAMATGKTIPEHAVRTATTAAVGARKSVFIYTIMVASGLSVLFLAGQFYRSAYGLIALIDARRHDEALARQLGALSEAVRAAESGQRGYLMSRDTSYLDPYRRAVATIPGLISSLRNSGDFDPTDIDPLQEAIAGKLAELSGTIADASDGNIQRAQETFREGRGRRLMVAIRERCEGMIGRIDGRLAARERPIRRSAGILLVLAPAVILIAIPAIACSLVVTIRSDRRRSRAEATAEVREAEVRAMIAEKQAVQFQADAADEEAKRNAEESNRAAHLLNALQHDLRTPLGGIGANAKLGLMLSALPGPSGPSGPSGQATHDGLPSQAGPQAGHGNQKFADVFRKIERLTASMRDLLDQFLETSRSEHYQPEAVTFDVCPLISGAAEFVASEADSKRIAVRVECQPGTLGRTDNRIVNRILINLISNAVKYTDRGAVIIRAERVDTGDFRGIRIAVADTGRGIAPEMIPNLFREFVQADNPARDPRKGFGLGLSLVRRMVASLGGRVEVESVVGRGSMFTVTLPDIID